MPSTGRNQKLAAILAADVAGYSVLMGDDAHATVEALDACRAVFREHVGAHGGRIVDTAGDSVLAVFASAIGAVQAACAVQDALRQKNTDLPDHRRMQFRIGVNLGDVIEKADGTIYGDGVNIAARLEGLAVPGGFTISRTVFDSVDGKVDAAFEDIGEHEIKNIARPVRVYRVGGLAKLPILAPPPKPDKPSIAVLPFNNLSGDPEQDYFADGISEDIITDLSKASGLLVIARNSSFAYKGRSPDISKVARELAVAFVLEGSVRKAGGRVRINAQLVDVATSAHVWAERYDRDLDNIFAVQDDVTRQIVKTLKVKVTDSEAEALAFRSTSSVDAYDAYLRAREAFASQSAQGHAEAKVWLERALFLDARFADALALLSQIHGTNYVNRWAEGWEESNDAALELAIQAVAANDRSGHAHATLGNAHLWFGDPALAVGEMERAVALDPNFAPGHLVLAMALHYRARSRDALDRLATVKRLDPYRPNYLLHYQALCHFMLGDYETAGALLRERIANFPDTDIGRALLASVYGHLGSFEQAKETWSELMEINPNYSFAKRRMLLPYKNPEDPERIAEGLRKAGLEP